MCIIVAKYFKDKGWVLAKNRDQDYVSHVSFHDMHDDHVGEILTMYDKDIKYQEGMNHQGLVIMTTSLTPQIEEETNDDDGDKIFKALHMSQEDAVNYLTKEEMTGFIFVATPRKLMLIEAARDKDGKGEYRSKVRIIPKDKMVVRTNHGIDFPWAGFQYGVSALQDKWRKSSESRKRLAEKACANSTSPEEMLDCLSAKMDDDLQMNLFRVEKKPKDMRTIFQWVLVPSEGIAYIRPVQTKMTLKVSHKKLTVKVLENDYLQKLYKGHIKHFSKIKVLDGGKECQTMVTENRLPTLKEYIDKAAELV